MAGRSAVCVYPVVVVAARLYVRQRRAHRAGTSSDADATQPRERDVRPCRSRHRPGLPSSPSGRRLRAAARRARRSDFYVAGRTVTPRWNARGDQRRVPLRRLVPRHRRAGLHLGADMLWFPVGYTVGYLVLLVLVAAPLRRSGAYTLPDFAEARLESRRGAPRWRRCSSSASAGSTCCRSSRAPGSRCSTVDRRAGLGSAASRRRRRARQRRRRRHAVDHPRAGHAVLAQAHRHLGPGVRPARAVVAERRAGPT